MATGCLTMGSVLRFVRLCFHTDVLLGDPVCEHQGCVYTDVLLGDPVCEYQERVCTDVLLGDPVCERQVCVHTSQAGYGIH